MRSTRVLLLFIFGLLLVGAGFVYPATIPAPKFEGWKQDASNAAVELTHMVLDHPLEKLVILRLMVIDIQDKGPAPHGFCGSQRFSSDHAFEATVDARTLFGIRVARVVATCGSAGRER